jgi:hypothetical protein
MDRTARISIKYRFHVEPNELTGAKSKKEFLITLNCDVCTRTCASGDHTFGCGGRF